MSRNVGSTRGIKRRCDLLFSQLIRSRGACEYCGRKPPEATLQTAHLLSRRFIRTRYEPSNAFALCGSCHMAMTDDPVKFALFALTRLTGGQTLYYGDYDQLVEAAHSKSKVDWLAVERGLRIMLENSGA